MNDVPGFRDVKEQILSRIRARTWLPGSSIPSEVALAEEFGCARGTVNRAMQELAAAGILDRKRRAGTRIATVPRRATTLSIPLIREEIEATGATYRFAVIERQIRRVPAWLAARLSLPQDAKVLHVVCLHFAGNEPHQLEERWINLDVVPAAAKVDFTMLNPNEWLIQAVPLTDAEFAFYATEAPDDAAKLLGIRPASAVFIAERSTRLNDKPVTFARLTFKPGYRMVTRS